MSNEEDCCFQWQVPGHITGTLSHIRHYECKEYGHIIMDCPHRLPPSRTPVTHHKAHKGHHVRPSLRHHHEDWDRQSQSRYQFHYQDITALSHHNSHRGHSRSKHWDRCSYHRSNSQWSCSAHRGNSHRFHHDTLHWSRRRTSTYHSSLVINPMITVGHIYDHPTDLQGINHCRSDSHSSRMRRSTHPKKNMEVK